MRKYELTMEHEMAVDGGINELPEEMLLEVFKYLNLDNHQLIKKYTEICVHWRETIALGIVAPRIARVASSNVEFKKLIGKNGWTEECNDTELLLFIHHKTMNTVTSKLLTAIFHYHVLGVLKILSA